MHLVTKCTSISIGTHQCLLTGTILDWLTHRSRPVLSSLARRPSPRTVRHNTEDNRHSNGKPSKRVPQLRHNCQGMMTVLVHHRVILRRAIRPNHLLLSDTFSYDLYRAALSQRYTIRHLQICCTHCNVDKHAHFPTNRCPRCCANERIPPCFSIGSQQWLNARSFNVGIFGFRVEVDEWAGQCCPVVAVR